MKFIIRHSRPIMLIASFCFGVLTVVLCSYGIWGWLPNRNRPTVTVPEFFNVSGCVSMVIFGGLLIYAPLQTYLKSPDLFKYVNAQWVRKQYWSSFNICIVAGVLCIVPFVVLLFIALICHGTVSDDSILLSSYYLYIYVLSNFTLAVTTILLLLSFTYSQIRVNLDGHAVSKQKKRWPFPVQHIDAGNAVKLEVLPIETLDNVDFVNPSEDVGWLVLRTTKSLMPLQRFHSYDEMQESVDFAATWNRKLKLDV